MELEILARLQHPNILSVYGGCLNPPNLFMVIELMSGDLASFVHCKADAIASASMAQQPPYSLATALRIALDVITGVVSPVASVVEAKGQVIKLDVMACLLMLLIFLWNLVLITPSKNLFPTSSARTQNF
jgi:serine/threonine protein kinase